MKKSLLIISLMVMGIAVFAQEYRFTNVGADNLWNNPLNWDQGSVPSTIDHVVYIGEGDTDYNVEIQADAFCGYLFLGSPSSLVVRNNATLTVSYPNSGPTGTNIQTGGASTLTIDEGGILKYDGALVVGNTLIVNGTIDLVPSPPSK